MLSFACLIPVTVVFSRLSAAHSAMWQMAALALVAAISAGTALTAAAVAAIAAVTASVLGLFKWPSAARSEARAALRGKAASSSPELSGRPARCVIYGPVGVSVSVGG